MPGNHCDGCSKPTKHRVSENVADATQASRAERWLQDILDNAFRQAVQDHFCRLCQQNEWSSHYHEQKMLDHVKREEFVIQYGERRARGEPHAKETTYEGCNLFERSELRRYLAKAKPPANVEPCGQGQKQG